MTGLSCPLLKVRKCRAGLPDFHVACKKDTGRAAQGRHGSCIFGRRPAHPPARHGICTFLVSPCRLPVRLAIHPRSKSLRGCWWRCSRRGRAEASLLTGFVHRCHPSIPPPSLAVATAHGAAPRQRALNTRSRPPPGGSLPASGLHRTTASRRPAHPSGKRYFSLARDPADFAALRLPDHGLSRGRLRDLRTLRTFASILIFGPSADTRFAVTALVLQRFYSLPAPGATSLCSDAPGLGSSMRMLVALQSPGSRRSVAPHRLCASPPPQYSPALPRGCNRPRCRASLRPVGRLTPAPVRPQGLPACLRATPDDRFAATGSPLRQKVFSPYPVPADFAALRLPDHGLFRGRLRDLRTLRPSASILIFGPPADTRFAATALALQRFFSLPAPGATSLCSDAPRLGSSMRMVAALQSPGSRRSVAPHRLCASPPLQYPPPSLAVATARRGRAPRRPARRLTSAPVRPQGLPACLRATPDDRFTATGSPLRQKVLFPCPAPADFAALRLPRPGVIADVAVTCGHGNRLLLMLVLRDAADTGFAVTTASLRSLLSISPPPGDLGSLGRPEAGVF